MNDFYNWIRPIITRGDVLNEDSVRNKSVIKQAIDREEAKHSKTRIMRSFYHSLSELMDIATNKKNVSKVMDVGCSRGEMVAKLALERPELSFIGIDINKEAIAIAAERYNNIKNLLFQKKNFLLENTKNAADLIVCLETLEHIEDQSLQIFAERLFYLAPKALILSVPCEPLWCLANIMRFKYWSRLGNTPSHLQHWTKRTFEAFVAEVARKQWGEHFEMISRNPFKLWTMILLVNNNKPEYKVLSYKS